MRLMRYPSPECRSVSGHEALSMDDTVFDVRIVHLDGQMLVSVSGELDIATVDRLWAALDQTISPEHPLILDMRGVTFFGAEGVRLLRRALERLDGDPARLIVRSPSPITSRVLGITATDQLVTIQAVRHEPRKIEAAD